MTKEVSRKYSYNTTFKLFVALFLFLTLGALGTLLFQHNLKKNNLEEIDNIIRLDESLEKLNEKVKTQYTSKTININDIFIEYSYFKDQAVDHAGLEDLTLLDSMAKVGETISLFKIRNKDKEHLEILFHLAELDTLLVKANPETFFDRVNNQHKVSKAGKNFEEAWEAKFKKLSLLFSIDLNRARKEAESIANQILFTTTITVIVMLLFSLALILYIGLIIYRDLKILKTNSKRIKNGKKPSIKNTKLFGESHLINTNLTALYHDITQTKTMLEKIHAEGESNIHGNDIFIENILYESISKLELQLADLKEKERNRNWSVEGISLLTEVVNQYSSNPEELYSNFLLKLIKYLGAIQGGIFIVQNEKELRMATSYAYDRIKKQKKTISKGEGLVGQVWEEKKHLYAENIPEDHHTVRSALGEAKTSSLVVAPLIERQEIYGVIEISSFSRFKEEELDLILKASGILASATSNIEANLNTKKLLEDSNLLASQMKQQEEELNNTIAKLKSKIELEQRSTYLKERALRDLRFDFERTKELKDRQIKNLEGRLEELKKSITKSQSDNEFTRELELKIEAHTKKVEDLAETIRIKNLKIERLKSKIEKLSE